MATEEKIPVFGRGMRNTGGMGGMKSKHAKMGKFGDSKGPLPGKGPQQIDNPSAPVNPGVPVIVNPGKPVAADPVKKPVVVDPGKSTLPGNPVFNPGVIQSVPKKKP